ncbi:MAG: hypothetical protein GY928_37505 [Colwellia sp.]|nr:hypothetical protein [Colwellia sp.]
MIDFLIHKDIDDSTLIDAGEISLIGRANEKKFLDKANKFYLEEALELGVDKDDIMVYDPNVDTEDLRNNKCIELVEYHFLKNAFFSLWKGGDKEKDVYYNKYIEAKKEFNNMMSSLTVNRIKGKRPAERKTSNSYSTVTRYLGDGASTNYDPNIDPWDA